MVSIDVAPTLVTVKMLASNVSSTPVVTSIKDSVTEPQ